MFHQTKKTLIILSYNDLNDESFKSVIDTLARYKRNHEGPLFSINNAKDVTANLINVFNAVQDPEFHDKLNKPIM